MDNSDRIQRELSFHDERFSSDEERSSNRFYAIAGASSDDFLRLVDGIPASSDVLEIGCGDDAQAWRIAPRHSHITAIDISPVAIADANERIKTEQIENLSFIEMNAENIDFAPDSFDAIIGSGVLHHLDLGLCFPGLASALKPSGTAIFLEPMGHNPLIEGYRRLTPSERTQDEHPLLRSDLRFMERWFESVEVNFFHLAALAALPFTKTRHFDRLMGTMNSVDRVLLNHSKVAQNLAWFVTIQLRGPKVLKAARD